MRLRHPTSASQLSLSIPPRDTGIALYRQKKGDELMRMSHGHKLNDLLNVASRETGCVLKMSSNSEKN